MKNCKFIKKTSVLILVLAIIASFLSFSVSAEKIIDIPYTTYTYWEGAGNTKSAVPTKAVYEPKSVITGQALGTQPFNNIGQIFSDGNYIYVVDSNNSRIVKINQNHKVDEIISSVKYGDKALKFSNPTGVFVSGDEMYIADTDNERVLCCRDDTVFKILTLPNSTIIPEDFIYKPIRVIKDNNGYVYVLCDGSFYGMLVYSSQFEFCGFFGANEVKSSLFGAVKNLFTSLFETEQKHAASVQQLPYQTIDMCLDPEGFVCTVNNESEGQIKRLGAKGGNILIYSNQFAGEKADSFNFGDFPTGYVDVTSKYSSYVEQKFNAITTDSDGYIYATDSTQGRIYMYDNQCNLITVFGGGTSAGNQIGTFTTPNSLAVMGDRLFVSDYVSGDVTVFKMTEYGKNFKLANTLTNNGEYIASEKYWKDINSEDKNCQLAYKGLAKAALKAGRYDVAMEYAKTGLDRVTYASAFKVVRNQLIADNFVLIAIVAVALVGGLVALLIISKKREIVFIKNKKLKTALTTPIHPFNSFYNIKFKEEGSVLIATVLLVLYYIAAVVKVLSGGFMYVITDLTTFNSIFTIIGTIGVVLLWVCMNWVASMLSEGKGTLKEVYCSTCYCLIPQILYNIIFVIVSHTVVATSNSAFGVLLLICNIFTVGLILISMTVIQDFTFFKSMFIGVISIILMGIAAFVICVIFILGQDFIGFIVGIVREIMLR